MLGEDLAHDPDHFRYGHEPVLPSHHAPVAIVRQSVVLVVAVAIVVIIGQRHVDFRS